MIFTPYHALAAYRIIQQLSNKKRIVVLSTIDCGMTFNGCTFVKFKSIRNFRDLLKEIVFRERKKKLIGLGLHVNENVKDINLYFPHYYHLMANYLANYLLANKIKSLNIIPDGVLNYYNFKQDNTFLRKQYIQKITSFFIGLQYRSFKGGIINPFGKIDIIYSYCPELTVCYGAKVKKILYTKSTLPLESGNVLIIGTDTRTPCDQKIRECICDLININEKAIIFYKKHPSVHSDENIKLIADSISPFRIVELPLNGSVSEITKAKAIRHVYSIGFSTVIMELQDEFDCELDTYAFSYDISIRKELAKIKERYKIKSYVFDVSDDIYPK